MSMIDEKLAKRNHDNYSMSDYKEGSATKEYNDMIAAAEKKIEEAKEKVSDEGKVKLDNLLNWYKAKLADWTNRHNKSGSNHVSWFIAGASNYNMRKHEKWLQREGNLWAEYNEIKDISSKISTIVAGDKIIKSDDPNALEKLKIKLDEALKEHEGYKEYNKKARKEGNKPNPAWVLSNSNQRIRAIKDRIARLEKLEEQKKINPVTEILINDIRIVDSLEANRVQIFFGFKPDEDVRKKLKKNGFRWTPSIEAWQHYRAYNAMDIAKAIVSEIQ